jgi:hypothetical protein
VTLMRQPALCRLPQKYSRLPVSRSAYSSIADMIACTSTWLPGTVMRTCSARAQRCRTFQSAAMNWDGSVSGSYQWVLS